MKKLLTFLFVLFVSFKMYSDNPVRWNFTDPDTGLETTVATVVPPGVIASNALFGADVKEIVFAEGNGGSGHAYTAQSWTNQNVRRDGDYLEFCIEAELGTTFDITTFEFANSSDPKGPRLWDVTYIIDGGTEVEIKTGGVAINDDSWNDSGELTVTDGVNLFVTLSEGQSICFRVYGYDAKGGSGVWKLDDAVISGTGAIPIKLLNFEATKELNTTVLDWQTLSETNSDYFALEWSRDGRNFEELATVDGVGTSREKQEYKYIHTNPTKGINYYRLSQFDFNGRSETFKIVSFYLDIDNINMRIIPNRVKNVLRIDFDHGLGVGSVQIYNIEGRMIGNYGLLKGENELEIDVNNFNIGQYFVRCIGNNKVLTKKFIKL